MGKHSIRLNLYQVLVTVAKLSPIARVTDLGTPRLPKCRLFIVPARYLPSIPTHQCATCTCAYQTALVCCAGNVDPCLFLEHPGVPTLGTRT